MKNNEETKSHNCGSIKEILDELEDKQPPEGTKEYEDWKIYFNKFAKIYNNLAKFTAYKEIN
jgi:hypothetical protein